VLVVPRGRQEFPPSEPVEPGVFHRKAVMSAVGVVQVQMGVL